MPLIRCLTPFPGGTKLQCNGRMYHFLPNDQNHFVADVNEKDERTVLSIGAGYQPYNPDDYDAIVAQDDMVPDFDKRTTVRGEAGTEVEVNRDYLRPATQPPKESKVGAHRTDQHKERVKSKG